MFLCSIKNIYGRLKLALYNFWLISNCINLLPYSCAVIFSAVELECELSGDPTCRSEQKEINLGAAACFFFFLSVFIRV